MEHKIGQEDMVIVMDVAIHAKAHEIIWKKLFILL
jgi:hypothetical protein